MESKHPYVSAVRGHVRLDDDPDVKEVRRCGSVASLLPAGTPIKMAQSGSGLHL